MPKGALHNLHLNGAASPDLFLKLTYDECVYFSMKEKFFKISRDGNVDEGYVPCFELRKFMNSADEFDKNLREHFTLTKKDVESKESLSIWGAF